jgi:hypothetical protein
MTDLRNDVDFSNALDRAFDGIEEYAERGVADAEQITDRDQNVNQNSGHVNLVALAVHFARHHPDLMQEIHQATSLDNGMSTGDRETYLPIWDTVQEAVSAFIETNGDDIVIQERQGQDPQSVSGLSDTYLPQAFGGTQDTGGGGGTVVKRTLKLLAHLQIAQHT